MARPEDTLARGSARHAGGFDQGFEDGQAALRRDPRQPFDVRRQEPPLRAPASNSLPPEPPLGAAKDPMRGNPPGVTPRFDPYVAPQAAAQGRPQPQQDPRGYRPDMPLQDGYGQPPRAPLGVQAGQRPAPYANQTAMPPANDPRYAAALGGGATHERPPTMGRPGQTQRAPVPGYAPPAPGYALPPAQAYAASAGQQQRPPAGYDAVPATGRVREPFFEAPPPRQAPPAARPVAGFAQDGYGDDPYADTAEAEPEDADYESEDDESEDTAAPRSRRGLFVTAALVLAIAVGGGMGYAYKLSMGKAGAMTGVPLLKADTAPAKTMAAISSQGADASKKTILERANDSGADGSVQNATVVSNQEQVAVQSDAQATDASGQGGAQTGDQMAVPRKVATVVVKPGEKIAPMLPAAVDAGMAPDAAPADSVPSITIGNMDAPVKAVEVVKAKVKTTLKTAQTAAAQMAVAAVLPAPDAGAGQDPAADAATPDMADPAMADTVTATKSTKPIKLGTIPPKPAKKAVKVAAIAVPDPAADAGTDPAADAATMSAPPAAKMKLASASAVPKSTGGSGYLIQVRSAKTQAEALAYFADLQQKYGDVLGSGQPDIQEADVPGKGKMFRLRIGPPGSGSAAKEMCGKLKGAGLKDCIVAQF